MIDCQQWEQLVPNQSKVIDADGHEWLVVKKLGNWPIVVVRMLLHPISEALIFSPRQNNIFFADLNVAHEFIGPRARFVL